MIVVREGSLTKHIDTLEELFEENWNESGLDFPLKLDKERYKQFDAAGILLAVGAFDGDEVIGYSVGSILPHPYNPDVMCFNSDCIFVRKDMRYTSAGARLMFETERLAKMRGAKIILWHPRGDTEFVETLTKRGGKIVDVVVMKEL